MASLPWRAPIDLQCAGPELPPGMSQLRRRPGWRGSYAEAATGPRPVSPPLDAPCPRVHERTVRPAPALSGLDARDADAFGQPVYDGVARGAAPCSEWPRGPPHASD